MKTMTNATFEHSSLRDESTITDALSIILDRAPCEPDALARYVERASAVQYAEFYLGRAYTRMQAIGKATKPYLRQRYTADFAEAANAADLLIASDVLMALLLDSALRGSAKLGYLLGMFVPEAGTFEPAQHSFDMTGSAEDVLTVIAPHDGVDERQLKALAAWHRTVMQTDYGCKVGEEGFLADVAFLREQLFESYLERDCDMADDAPVSQEALLVSGHAILFATALVLRRRERLLRSQNA
jgi:hypothetical protein